MELPEIVYHIGSFLSLHEIVFVFKDINRMFYRIAISIITDRYASDENLWRMIKTARFAEKILENGRVDPSFNDNFAIRCASESGHLELVCLLLRDFRVDPSAVWNYSVVFASSRGHVNVVRELMDDQRVDPSADQNLALELASRGGHHSVIRELLKDKRVNPSSRHNVSLIWASVCGHSQTVRELMQDSRVDPSEDSSVCLRMASYHGHVDVIKELLKDARTDPIQSGTNEEGMDSLRKAVDGYRSVAVMKVLLRDPRVDKNHKNEALVYASSVGNLPVVREILMEEDLDPMYAGGTAFRLAGKNGHVDVISELLRDERCDFAEGVFISVEEALSNGHVDAVERLFQNELIRDVYSSKRQCLSFERLFETTKSDAMQL